MWVLLRPPRFGASADLVAERCDAAICPEPGEEAEVGGLHVDDQERTSDNWLQWS